MPCGTAIGAAGAVPAVSNGVLSKFTHIPRRSGCPSGVRGTDPGFAAWAAAPIGAVVIASPFLVLGLLWYRAVELRYYAAHTRLAGLGFTMTVRGRNLFMFYLVNGLILGLSLGLLFPILVRRRVTFWTRFPLPFTRRTRPGASPITTLPLRSCGASNQSWVEASSADPGNCIGPMARRSRTMNAPWLWHSDRRCRS